MTKSNQTSTKYSQMYSTVSIGLSHTIFTSSPPPPPPPPPPPRPPAPPHPPPPPPFLPQMWFLQISLQNLFLLLPLTFFDQETPSPLQKMHNISVGLDKPPHMLFFCFKQSSLFGASFSSTVEHPLKSICSFNRPRCPFLNKIRALTDLFLNNFLF